MGLIDKNYRVDMPQILKDSNQKFKKEILFVAPVVLKDALFPIRMTPGIYGKETLASFKETLQLGDYDPFNITEDGSKLTPRTLETYLGSCINVFDPNRYVKTIYDEIPRTQGKALTQKTIVKFVLQRKMDAIVRSMVDCVFTAKRVPGGKNTTDLFDGFNTIAQAEMTAGNISTDKGNLIELATVIDSNNAYDQIKGIWRKLNKDLKKNRELQLLCDPEVYEAYCEDYAQTFGHAVYADKYDQVFVQGTAKKLKLVPKDSLSGSQLMYVQIPNNMRAGCGVDPDKHSQVNMDVVQVTNPLLLDFVATQFFGVQFSVIEPEFLCVIKLKTAA